MASSRRRHTKRHAWFAMVLGAIVATVVSMIASAAMSDAAGEASYVPVSPARILDTRPAFQVGPFGTPWGAGETRSVTVTGVGGVPLTAVEAVVVNVTTVSPTAASFLTVFPTGEALPLVAASNFVAGEIKNDLVIAQVGAGGQISIYNAAGTVDLVIDVVGYHTSTVESRVAELEALVVGLSRETVDGEDTLRLTGANLQIVNGTDTTYDVRNGVGNLIIGYNANSADARPGSHNLVVGDRHTYQNNGTVIFGYNNRTNGAASSVTGGESNTASGRRASVTGGQSNTAAGHYSSVTGGASNEASGDYSSVGGGALNGASGLRASVTGGFSNSSTGAHSSITGGRGNTAAGVMSTVTGGAGNAAPGTYSSVTGGLENNAAGSYSSVTGGRSNDARGDYSSVDGGLNRTVVGLYDWRAGTLFENN